MKNKTVFQKIFSGIIALVVLALVLYCSFIFMYEYKTNKENSMKEAVEVTNEINKALKDYINQIDGTISSFYYELYQNNSGALATLLTAENELTGYAKAQQLDSLDKYFSKLFVMRNDFVDVYIYSNAKKNYIYSTYGGKTLDYDPANSKWYQRTLDRNGKTTITIDYVAEQITYKKPVIGFSRMFKNINGEGILDDTVVMLDFTMDNLDELLDNYIANDMTTIMLVDDEGNVVYQRGADNTLYEYWKENEVTSGAHLVKSENERYIIAGSNNKVYEWNVVLAMNMDYIMLKILDYVKFTIVIFGMLTIGAAAVSFIFARNICRPIKTLEKGMQTIQNGDFDINLHKESSDEIGQLIDHFNIMTAKIKELIKEKYEEELQKKEAQYKFLQAQIDPHFIFNTLQIISSMALVYKTPEIGVVSNSLAGIIRYSISDTEKTISLKEEMKNVKSYLEIQKIRFKNRLSYEILTDTELENISIIKLILQPIVENSITHGLEHRNENGKIKIHVFSEEDKVYIKIIDNGNGMDNEILQDLIKKINTPIQVTEIESDTENMKNAIKNKGNHVGLRNINLRLKMYYGDEYGLFIESSENKGTTVTVCIRRE